MGVGASLDELLAEARATGWSLTPGVAFPLLDPTFWAPTPVEMFRTWSAFLHALHEEAPDRFEAWVYRFLDAANRNLPGRSFGFLAQSFLLIAWQPFNQQARPVRTCLDCPPAPSAARLRLVRGPGHCGSASARGDEPDSVARARRGACARVPARPRLPRSTATARDLPVTPCRG
jgi:hypothetical protein